MLGDPQKVLINVKANFIFHIVKLNYCEMNIK